jgi:pSer/pThr/pTyr-binding forkhead associated (FHA) protein
VVRASDTGEERAFRDRLAIGRDPGSDLVLEAETVSRQHAEIRRGATGWEVHHRSRTNRTTRVRLGVATELQPEARTDLRAGDALRLGAVELRFSERLGAPLRLDGRALEGDRAVLEGGVGPAGRRPVAFLTEEDGVWFLRALGTGEVRVNGVAVTGVQRLADGDELDLDGDRSRIGGAPAAGALRPALASPAPGGSPPRAAAAGVASSGAPRPMAWRLVRRDGGPSVALPHAGMLGRSPVVTPFVVDDPSVSRHHLDVTPTVRGLQIVNRGRRTVVNGRILAPAEAATLGPGDALELGDVALTLEATPVTAAGHPAPR